MLKSMHCGWLLDRVPNPGWRKASLSCDSYAALLLISTGLWATSPRPARGTLNARVLGGAPNEEATDVGLLPDAEVALVAMRVLAINTYGDAGCMMH